MGAHNPDVNPDWTPKFARRVYKCSGCGHEIVTETNHTGSIYPLCKGSCRQEMFKFTPRFTKVRRQTIHVYIKDA